MKKNRRKSVNGHRYHDAPEREEADDEERKDGLLASKGTMQKKVERER
jgi:hypothetical protein